MPEYLAPGVYVEETSFRAKSIEGVSTSTTAFVGPTRKGPLSVTPELLTSFADFERIYGGFENLDLSSDVLKNVNYLAHAVRAYFDNGGSRLYVSRVPTPGASSASSSDLLTGAGEVQFMARFPGKWGEGEILLYQKETPTSAVTLGSAPVGSILRIGGSPPQAAQLEGGTPPFAVSDGGKLLLTINGTQQEEIVFRGRSVEALSDTALDPTTDLTNNRTLTVRIGENGPNQTIDLPNSNAATPTDIITAINSQLRSGYARLTTDADPAEIGAGRLAIGTDVRGKTAWIQVTPHAPLKLSSTSPVVASTDAASNNVNDLGQVTIAQINALLQQQTIPVQAAQANDKLVLRTTDSGADVTLAVRAGDAADNSVHSILGLNPAETDEGEAGGTTRYFLKQRHTPPLDEDDITPLSDWRDVSDTALTTADITQTPTPKLDFLTLRVVARDGDGNELVYDDLGLDPRHPRWIKSVLAEHPTRRTEALTNPFALSAPDTVNALVLRSSLFDSQALPRKVSLTGGANGSEPKAQDYKTALEALESLEDISIMAAPGHSVYDDFQAIESALITHVERRRAYRFAVLDTPPNNSPTEARQVRSRIDSKYAALYYPWIWVANPLARAGVDNVSREILLPPSGFVCGIYARNDIERGVYKAPANEVVRGTLRFETDINFAQQEMLNPLGINCLRFFPGRGYRVWGARTASSDPEWKYVSDVRYFNYLKASIDRSTQWAVFEPNGERLWTNIRDTVTAFLYNEWRSGALLGSSPQEAFFVRCDRSTMTQNDLDNGRLICLIGVANVKPAEFVIFRIGQKTAEART